MEKKNRPSSEEGNEAKTKSQQGQGVRSSRVYRAK